MGFKEYERNMSFLDLELSKTLGSSRTQKFLKEIHDYIRWEPFQRSDGCVSGRKGSGWQQCISSGDVVESPFIAEMVWYKERP